MNKQVLHVAIAAIALASCNGPQTPTPMLPLAPGPGATAPGPYGVYAAVLAHYAHQRHYRYLLVSGSAFQVAGSPFSKELRDSVFGPAFRRQTAPELPLQFDSLAAPVPILLLGDTIDLRRDWDELYRGRRHASPILTLAQVAIDADSARAVVFVSIIGEGLDYVELRREGGTWVVHRRHQVAIF